jgi:hypothetical protein
MPFGDGTGPMGLGPMTGRGGGFCAGFGMPGFANPMPRRGWGRGWGGFGWRMPYGYPYAGGYGAPYMGYGYPYYGGGYTPSYGYPYGYSGGYPYGYPGAVPPTTTTQP